VSALADCRKTGAESSASVAGGTRIRDMVRYALPFGIVGRLVHACRVRSELKATFDFRARKVAGLLGAVFS
jgi:hypothetical protein